jgi:hypothetical protein
MIKFTGMKNFGLIFLPLMLAGYMLIQKDLPEKQYDGPYVLYKNDKLFVQYIFEDGGTKTVRTDSMALEQKPALSLNVATDIPGKTFAVQLKSQLKNEKSEFKKVSKQLILSDIEGNFGAFRKLLQAGGVIDTAFNWTFGDGHLVLTGDFFDRGEQVTEVLWLIYSLEEKAKAAGGYVHFVLGNHEIMNLSNDLRYVQPKYIQNAALLNENYLSLYNENSELGRWLRTKNIMERIGDILFMHGGISAEMNKLDISIAKINELSRPFYPDTTYKYPDPRLDILYSDFGPFWYRGYYTGNPKATESQIDSTLEKFGIKHIATGHTIVAETISVWFNGKVFNTDVHHAKGHSEALLVDGGKYYRINAAGEKVLLLD